MPTYAVTIGGVAREIQPGWSISETANRRNTLTCQVLSADGSVRPALGAEVLFSRLVVVNTSSVANPTVITTDEDHGVMSGETVVIAGHAGSTPAVDGTYVATRTGATTFTIPLNVTVGGTGGTSAHRLFGGNINAPTEAGMGGIGGLGILTSVSAVDFNALPSRRVVTLDIVAGTTKAALQALEAASFFPTGMTLNSTQVAGTALPALSYADRNLEDVLNEIAKLSGNWIWDNSYDKTLLMFDPSTTASPVNVVDGNGVALGDIDVEPTRSNYANRIIVLAGTGQSELTDSFTGDGLEDTFALTLPMVANRGYVTNGGVNETLGTGATWSYDSGSQSIIRTSPPTNLNAISIIYTGQWPYRAVANDAAEQAANGIWEMVIPAPDVFSTSVADGLATAALAGTILTRKTVHYRTAALGLHPGQTQTMTVVNRNLTGTYVITDVAIRNTSGNRVERFVTAVGGTILPRLWQDVARQMFSGGTTSSGSSSAPSSIGSSGVGGTGTTGKLAAWVSALVLGDAPTVSVALGGTGTSTAFTAGSVVFAGASGVYAQDNADFFWDTATKRLSLGATSGASVLSIVNTSAINPLETHSANAMGAQFYTHSNTNFRAPTLELYRSHGTQGAPTVVAAGDHLGYLTVYGYNSGDAAYDAAFQLFTKASGDWTVAGTRTASTYLYAPAVSAGIEIGPLGTVGILTSPVAGYDLNVSGYLLASGLYVLPTGAISSDLSTVLGSPTVTGETNTSGVGHAVGIMYGTNTQAAWFSGVKTRSTADNTADTIVANNDGIVRLEGWGADGAAYRSAGYIELQVDGTPGASDMPGRWVFAVTPNASATPAEAMRISETKVTSFQGPITLKTYTVGTLPAGVVGQAAYCTDLTTPTFLAAAVGGGAVVGPVFYDGANWVTV